MEWLFLFFLFPVWPLLPLIEMESIGNGLPWKWMVWKPLRNNSLLKDPLSDSWAYFRSLWKWAVWSLPSLFGFQCSLDMYNNSYTASQHWDHHWKPASIFLIHLEDASFLFLSTAASDSKTPITSFAVVLSCSSRSPAFLIEYGHITFPASLLTAGSPEHWSDENQTILGSSLSSTGRNGSHLLETSFPRFLIIEKNCEADQTAQLKYESPQPDLMKARLLLHPLKFLQKLLFSELPAVAVMWVAGEEAFIKLSRLLLLA